MGPACETAQRLVRLFQEDRQKIQKHVKRAGTALRVFDALCERPILTLNEVVRQTGITFATAAKGMGALEKLGIAREITGKKRNPIFAYNRYLSILNEGTEPL